jgi:hypothetical protein
MNTITIQFRTEEEGETITKIECIGRVIRELFKDVVFTRLEQDTSEIVP